MDIQRQIPSEKEIYFDSLSEASGHYLCTKLEYDFEAEEWLSLSRKEQIQFVSENLWEPLEYADPEIILDQIIYLGEK